MKVKRGEVLLTVFPFATGSTAKKRPVLVVQADGYNLKLQNVLVAEISSNTVHSLVPNSFNPAAASNAAGVLGNRSETSSNRRNAPFN